MFLHIISNLKWLLHNFMSLVSQDHPLVTLSFSLSLYLSNKMHFVVRQRYFIVTNIDVYWKPNIIKKGVKTIS